MADGRIRVGIGGWTYAPWRETFYPNDLPQSRELEYAAGQFGAIEINATFYGRQSPKSWENWAKAVPDGFQFAVKGSRFCVTRPKLAEAGEGVRIFIGSENKLFSLSGSSLVVAPYHDQQQNIIGVLGVIGPTRLNYARIIPIVEYTAQAIGRVVS